jgi:crossover junction endodeoxyribonuclease RuvC
MRCIGIDPGLTGAVALYDSVDNLILDVFDTPTRERAYGHGLEVDWLTFNEKFIDLHYQEDDCLVILENVGVMPKQGNVAAFAFGQVVGGIRALLETLRCNYLLIHPVTWKKKFGLTGTDKYATLEMVRSVHPEARPLLTHKKHHNRADAMAIAVAGSMLHD